MVDVDIQIRNPGWRAIPDLRARLRRAAEAALAERRQPAAIAVRLAGDRSVRRLNAQYRGKNSATNVLSFPSGLRPELSPFLGDVVLAYETCASEAAAEGKSLEAHAMHLVVHGVLHLLGYDHQSETEAAAMEGREVEILASLGIPDPYAGAGEGASA